MLPHYRDALRADNQPPGAFARLIEKMIVPADDFESIAAQFCFDQCRIDRMFGVGYDSRPRSAMTKRPPGTRARRRCPQHDCRARQFVIRVGNQNGVHRAGNMRIVRIAEDDMQIASPRCLP